MFQRAVWLAFAALLLASCGGCEDLKKSFEKKDLKKPIEPPIYVAGTVSEFAAVQGGGVTPVYGYGLVVGLGKNGAKEMSAALRQYMYEMLTKKGIGFKHTGLGAVQPEKILRDPDTGAVTVDGGIPFGAPEGSRFDMHVKEAAPLRSLDGGCLLPADLMLAPGGKPLPPGAYSETIAEAGGTVFVNPFLDPNNPAESPRLREGRLIGGGVIKTANPVRLLLRQGDYGRAQLICRRINETFPPRENVNFANAKTRSNIEITVPPEWRDDYEHFIDLVLRIQLVSSPTANELKMRRLAQAMEAPGTDYHYLAMALEAMGKPVVPFLKKLYVSTRNPAAAFYSARTGLRLGDEAAGDVLVSIAANAMSAFRLPAIEELGRNRTVLTAPGMLRKLLDDDDLQVRIAAYEALLRYSDRTTITQTVVGAPAVQDPDADVYTGGQFRLDVVKCNKVPRVVYARQTMEARIVLFGQDMEVARPLFFTSPDGMVTIHAAAGDDKLTVYRKIPRTGKLSESFKIEPYVKTLVITLGSLAQPKPDGQIEGLNLTYGQVVSTLYRMCKSGDIKAKFDLQPLPGAQRMYGGTGTGERPEMPPGKEPSSRLNPPAEGM